MSYSEDNISAKSADMEYSVRARKRDQQAEAERLRRAATGEDDSK